VSISRAAPFGGSQTLHDVNHWPKEHYVRALTL
jgi:hypothetical protein